MKLVCIDTKDWYKNLTLNKIYDASPMTEESLRHIFDYIIIKFQYHFIWANQKNKNSCQ